MVEKKEEDDAQEISQNLAAKCWKSGCPMRNVGVPGADH